MPRTPARYNQPSELRTAFLSEEAAGGELPLIMEVNTVSLEIKPISGGAPSEGEDLAPSSLEAIADYNKALNFERHISEFFNDWKAEPILESYVRQRMQQLGLRPGQIGIVDEVETGSAFSLEHFMGGRNSRPAWNPTVTRGGVNVDPGVFNPELLAAEAPSWSNASLRDRIDAVIIHELMEYNSRAASTVLRHRRAILRSPSTTADISPGAGRILEEYRAWLLQQGGGK
jgi:hypothetical protein